MSLDKKIDAKIPPAFAGGISFVSQIVLSNTLMLPIWV
jgi:hypothetical protein